MKWKIGLKWAMLINPYHQCQECSIIFVYFFTEQVEVWIQKRTSKELKNEMIWYGFIPSFIFNMLYYHYSDILIILKDTKKI